MDGLSSGGATSSSTGAGGMTSGSGGMTTTSSGTGGMTTTSSSSSETGGTGGMTSSSSSSSGMGGQGGNCLKCGTLVQQCLQGCDIPTLLPTVCSGNSATLANAVVTCFCAECGGSCQKSCTGNGIDSGCATCLQTAGLGVCASQYTACANDI